MADWRRSQIPPDLGHGLVSGLDHNSAHECRVYSFGFTDRHISAF